ncbi:hypothetical protein V6N13_138054 [Hibiscus sabdariffa]|uniref:Uncharacterized protein n=1 Tax=Hibiscus sabdariffa TaxID=183260 RepID=A0ABR2QCD3_9ROSI
MTKLIVKGRKRDGKEVSSTTLVTCINSLVSELDHAKASNGGVVADSSVLIETDTLSIQWCDNATYDNQISDYMQS